MTAGSPKKAVIRDPMALGRQYFGMFELAGRALPLALERVCDIKAAPVTVSDVIEEQAKPTALFIAET